VDDFVDDLDDPEEEEDDYGIRPKRRIRLTNSTFGKSQCGIDTQYVGMDVCLSHYVALEAGKPLDTGIFPMIQAYPQAIEIRDTATHLYPFMMAAVAAAFQDDDNDEEFTLNTVFQLLLMQPQLVNTIAKTFSKRSFTPATSACRNSRKSRRKC